VPRGGIASLGKEKVKWLVEWLFFRTFKPLGPSRDCLGGRSHKVSLPVLFFSYPLGDQPEGL